MSSDEEDDTIGGIPFATLNRLVQDATAVDKPTGVAEKTSTAPNASQLHHKCIDQQEPEDVKLSPVMDGLYVWKNA